MAASSTSSQPQPERYDVIIIGTGQSGGPLATAFGAAGRKTAIVEREHVGGTCINVGCTPTKTMVASARVAYLARRGADYGVQTGPIEIDMTTVRRRKRDIVESFRSGSEHRLRDSENVTLLMGEASFVDAHTLDVSFPDAPPQRITAPTIIINTGCRPAVPPIPGLQSVPTLNSTTIMELDRVPSRLIVLGGGYIALEFGQMFRRFGARVTLIERGPQLLSRDDEDIAAEVERILREDGVEVLLQTKTVRIEPGQSGTEEAIHVVAQGPEGERTLAGSHLLVATGRTPNTERLNVSAAGLATDPRGYIRVNERLETNVPGVYALGDVNGGPAFTHISYDDYRILQANLIHNEHRTTAGRLVPSVVYIDPQLGHVGLSEREAKAQGKHVRVAKMPMSYVARALETDEPRGVMKALVDPETDQILGVTILGAEGGEIMSMLEIAMMGKLPYTALRDAIFAHPTFAESLNNLFSSFEE